MAGSRECPDQAGRGQKRFAGAGCYLLSFTNVNVPYRGEKGPFYTSEN